jgi:transcriptional regulator with XRE-family HTH domain/phage repressor protein C with HTH and peptisase S24 domain
MEELTQRFIDSYSYLKEGGLVKNDTDFATNLEVSRSMITEILKGRTNPGGKALQNIVRKYPIDGTWLLSGIGDMAKFVADSLPATERLQDHSNNYITNTPNRTGGGNVKVLRKPDPPTDPPTILLNPQIITVDRNGNDNIVHVPVRARAGYLTGYGDAEFVETLPSFSMPWLTDSTYRSFEIEGDSMYPTLKNKQIVIGQWVEKLEYIREDRVYILVTKTDGIIIKRLLNRIEKHGFIIAKSDAIDDRNQYPNLSINPEDIQEIWYAVWHGGFDFQSPSDTWRRINNHEADITVLQNTVNTLMEIIKGAGLLAQNGTNNL